MEASAYRAKTIVFADGNILHDKIIVLNGQFLVVFDDMDTAPDWYNIDLIEKMEDVELTAEKKMRIHVIN